MSIRLRHWGSDYGGCCFEIVLPSSRVLIIDPMVSASGGTLADRPQIERADYIAVTHNAWQAVRDAGPVAKKFDSKVICSHALSYPLKEFHNLEWSNIIAVTAGNTIVLEDLRIEVKKAAHPPHLELLRGLYKQATGQEASLSMTDPEMIEFLQSRKPRTTGEEQYRQKVMAVGPSHQGEHLNYVFQTSDNLRIYFYLAGAYDFLRDEIIHAQPNVFMMQVGRGSDLKRMTEFAALSRAEVFIPFGHKLRKDQPIDLMAKHLAENGSHAQILDIDFEQWYEIGCCASSAQHQKSLPDSMTNKTGGKP